MNEPDDERKLLQVKGYNYLSRSDMGTFLMLLPCISVWVGNKYGTSDPRVVCFSAGFLGFDVEIWINATRIL